MKKPIQLIILVLVFSQSHAFSQNISNNTKVTNSCFKYKEAVRGTLGTYANPPRLEDGRIDQKRLIAELKDIHANTYNWLIRTGNTDLEALKIFLSLARKAKLKVWATLVPPSEPPPSEPIKLDYERWAAELATLSLKEPNLVAWSIDDFVHNLKLFTPEYVGKFLAAAYAINPKLAFIPCCYFNQITPSFVTNYGHLLDGILFPYRAESVGGNLKDASQVENEIARLREVFGPKFPIILDIYASAHSRFGATTPEYVKEVLASGLKTADGVLIYRHQDPVKSPEKYQIIKKGFKYNSKLRIRGKN
jgi:hypothetical protein